MHRDQRDADQMEASERRVGLQDIRSELEGLVLQPCDSAETMKRLVDASCRDCSGGIRLDAVQIHLDFVILSECTDTNVWMFVWAGA